MNVKITQSACKVESMATLRWVLRRRSPPAAMYVLPIVLIFSIPLYLGFDSNCIPHDALILHSSSFKVTDFDTQVKRVCDWLIKVQRLTHERPQAWTRRGTCPPPSENVVNYFCALVVTAKRSVDELFVHFFHNLSSASVGLAPEAHIPTGAPPQDPAGDVRPQTSNLPTPEKILRASTVPPNTL